MTNSAATAGSVLCGARVNRRECKGLMVRGVIVHIARAGEIAPVPLMQAGDIAVQSSSHAGSTRVSSKHDTWQVVPHEEQTYRERLLSWRIRPFKPDWDSSSSIREQQAVAGIMCLLPTDIVNWEQGPWPDNQDDALNFLVEHLTQQQLLIKS